MLYQLSYSRSCPLPNAKPRFVRQLPAIDARLRSVGASGVPASPPSERRATRGAMASFAFFRSPRPRRVRHEIIEWWGGEDSNLRRLSQQIYSLPPLTAREPPHPVTEPEDCVPRAREGYTHNNASQTAPPRPAMRHAALSPRAPGGRRGGKRPFTELELARGLEPPTLSLQVRRSTG